MFSNNEPLLDSRIIDFARMAREVVRHAHLKLYTNGTLLTVEKFRSLMRYLDNMVIDNYNNRLVMHSNILEVYEYWKGAETPDKKVIFPMRLEDEELSSRGGYAPNRKNVAAIKASCLLPFFQMVVRPDGKLSLCCNDAWVHTRLATFKHSLLQMHGTAKPTGS